MTSLLILHPKKSSSSSIDQVTYYFLIHSIVFVNAGLSTIDRVLSTCTMPIAVPISFNLYNRQGSVLNFLNPALRVIVLMYSFNHQRYACTRTYIDFISVNIYWYG